MSDGTSHLLVPPLLATRGSSTAMDPSQVSKTPAPAGRSTKARRALGDISNHRRVTAASTTGKPAGRAPTSLSSHRTDFKPSKPLKFSPPTKKTLLTIPSKAPSATATSTTSNRLRANNCHKPLPQLSQPLLVQQQKVVVFDLDHDDDGEVEVPAGRLYMHQNVWAEDDDASSVDLSLEGAKTARAEILQALEDRYQRRIEWEQALEEREARQLDDAVERALQSDLDNFDPSPCGHIFDPEDPALESLVSADDVSYCHVDISF